MNETIIDILRFAIRQPAATVIDVSGEPLLMASINAALWFGFGAALGGMLGPKSNGPRAWGDAGPGSDEP